MGIKIESKKDIYWNYYLSLVNDLQKISDYIEFDKKNFNVYSTQLAKLLMSASSEVDVVLKDICNTLDSSKKHKNINDYRKTILTKLKEGLLTEKVYIHRHGLILNPWDKWITTENDNPLWWGAYNKVKHQRNTNFHKATLKNTINAMSALFLAIIWLKSSQSDGARQDVIKNAVCSIEPIDKFLQISEEYYPHSLLLE